MEKVQPDEVQAGRVGADAARMPRLAVRTEDRKVDPRQAVSEPRAPDNVRDVEHAAVLELRPAVDDAAYPRDALNAGAGKLLRRDANDRRTVREHPPAQTPSHGRANGQHSMKNEPVEKAAQEQARRGAVDAERGMARVAPRQPRRVFA